MRALALLLTISLGGCACDEPAAGAPEHPRLLVKASMKPELLERADDPQFAALYADIVAKAEADYREPDGLGWDYHAYNDNACIAQANAFLAWLHDDATRAQKARDYLIALADDYDTHGDWDINIRMPPNMICGVQAWDLLMATPYFPADEADAARAKLSTIAEAFYQQYVDEDLFRWAALVVTQNNHPIRTAATLIPAGLAFSDDPRAKKWLDWALAEYDYLFSPNGQYIQSEGGVSEGSFYFHFGFSAAIAAMIAADNAEAGELSLNRNCISRNPAEPWNGGDCIWEQPFQFDNPLRSELLGRALDWSVALRMGDGRRPSIADGGLNNPNGAALLAHWQPQRAHLVWDHLEQRSEQPRGTSWGMDLRVQHFAYLPRPLSGPEPAWKHRYMPDSGYAIFRSGWDEEQRFSVLLAEHGAARMTLHDHVDGGSFLLSAFGDYLVIDTGYYKPNHLDNAITAEAESHNLILVDGRGDAKKGLLNQWTGNDAFIEHGAFNEHLAYSEARTSYQDTEFRRRFAMVRERYWVVADALSTTAEAPRLHSWRLHAGAGRDLPGSVEADDERLRITGEHGTLDVHLSSTAGTPTWTMPPFEEGQSPHVHMLGGGSGHHEVMDGEVTAIAPHFLAVMVPERRGGEAEFAVTALAAPEDSVAYAVHGPDGDDIVWHRGPNAPRRWQLGETLLESDAALLIAADDGSFALLAGGSRASRDGEVIVEGGGDGGVVIWPEP